MSASCRARRRGGDPARGTSARLRVRTAAAPPAGPTRGVEPDLQDKIFEGPDADGLTDRQRALITATDEFVVTRGVSPETWTALSSHLDRAQLIEFCMLAGQYDALAATMTTLKMPLDFPD